MTESQETAGVASAATTVAAPATNTNDGDERLAYRGVFARLLVRPEIGAAIAAAAVWVFFWSVSNVFGLTGGTASILDVSSTLGIMAVAVAMLMIGGEFDLSSGAATGALGILTLMLVRDVTGELGGAGLSLWLALPISLLLALGLGLFNGFMVNRTSLPSFIVTLGSFFILKGAKLGFSKLIVDQIQVGKMDDLEIFSEDRGGDAGYAFFNQIFAAEWERNNENLLLREAIYIGLILAGAFLLFQAATRVINNASSRVPILVGLAGWVVGILLWMVTDGVSLGLFAAIFGLATIALAVGAVMGLQADGGSTVSMALAAVGAVALLAGLAIRWWVDDTRWTGEVRDFVYTTACLVGIALLVLAVYELRFVRKDTMNPMGLVALVAGMAGIVAGVAVLHRTDSVSGNTLGGVIIGASILVGLVGLAVWRYQTLEGRGGFGLTGPVVQAAAAGALALVASVVAALSLDPDNAENVTFLVTEQGLRAILFVVLASTGAVLLLMAANRAGAISQLMRSLILFDIAVLTGVFAFFIRSESVSHKFRTEVFSVMLVVAVLIGTWAIVTLFFGERRFPDATADRLGNRLVLAGGALFATGVVTRLLFTVQAELDAGISPAKFSVRTLWFLVFAAVCTWVLGQTRFGSWVFAVGGNKDAARQIGVPAARTKTQLFMLVSFAAWLVGTLLAFRLNTIQASTGDGLEFEYIIAAVVGGTALTGGYGSTLGAAIGAIIMAMSFQGIPASRWNSDWRFLFLGAILLIAVIGNNFIRSRAEATR